MSAPRPIAGRVTGGGTAHPNATYTHNSHKILMGLRSLLSGVGAAEQIAERLPLKQRAPSSPLMLRTVVDQMASLAEGREVGVGVVGRVVISVSGGKDDFGSAGAAQDVGTRPDPDPPPPTIAPATRLSVPPAAIAEVIDHLTVRSPTALAPALRAAEADRHRQLAPVDRVEEAVLGPDRHDGGTVPPSLKEA